MDVRKPLLAAEGAGRVAARGRHRQAGDSGAALYTYEACGSHEFAVVSGLSRRTEITRTLPCTCGEARDDIGALVRTETTVQYALYGGVLGDDHRVDWGECDEEALESDEEDLEREIVCAGCCDAAADSDGD